MKDTDESLWDQLQSARALLKVAGKRIESLEAQGGLKHYGWTVKDLSTGELSIEEQLLTFDPKGHPHHDLIEGYVWQKVEITYKEV